jgi:UDP-N-acetylmuramate--alanine ligase
MLPFIGGIVENYNSNLIGDGETVTVVEADNLIVPFAFASNIACITSMDADHLDIYGINQTSFLEFADKVEDKSQLFITKDLPLTGVTVAVAKMLFTVLLTLESKMEVIYSI